jgi:hypothetical protein
MDCLNCTNLPARMMDKGIWWTDANGEPMLKDPGMKEAAADWMRFHDYEIEIDWGNQVAMVKEGQCWRSSARTGCTAFTSRARPRTKNGWPIRLCG